MYQLLIIILIVLVFFGVKSVYQQPSEKRPGLLLRYGLYALLFITIALVITGRMHWVAAAIAAVFPIIQRLLPLLLRIVPFIKKSEKNNHSNNSKTSMDIDQASKIFGFTSPYSEEDVIKRHRELIQKNHPDRGGSDFLAAQINEAKDVLLHALKDNKKG